VFISKALADHLRGNHVVDTEDVRRFSDHNIVVIDLEL
jgi:hypothetical protein